MLFFEGVAGLYNIDPENTVDDWEVAMVKFAKAAGSKDPDSAIVYSTEFDGEYKGIFWSEYLASSEGMGFDLWVPPGFAGDDVVRLKNILKANRDVVGIKVNHIKEWVQADVLNGKYGFVTVEPPGSTCPDLPTHLILSRKWSSGGTLCVWYRPDHKGYTRDLKTAGRYTQKEAERVEFDTGGDCVAVSYEDVQERLEPAIVVEWDYHLPLFNSKLQPITA